jgi:hypothetical protein
MMSLRYVSLFPLYTHISVSNATHYLGTLLLGYVFRPFMTIIECCMVYVKVTYRIVCKHDNSYLKLIKFVIKIN